MLNTQNHLVHLRKKKEILILMFWFPKPKCREKIYQCSEIPGEKRVDWN